MAALLERKSQSCLWEVELDTLSAFFDHELPPEKHAQLVSHIGVCSRCTEILRGFRMTGDLLRSLSDRASRTV